MALVAYQTVNAAGEPLITIVQSNAELVAELAVRGVESSPDWIETRTGIRQRYICGEGESTFTLARDAAMRALDKAGVKPADVGVIVVATCTPDLTFPSVAAMVPLVVMGGAGSELYRGLGAVVVGGLLLSTIFTLIITPTLMSLMMDLSEGILGIRRKFSRAG